MTVPSTEPEPGELFREIYALSRQDQLARVAKEANDVLTCDPENLDYRLATLEYTIHVIRGAIWDEDMARIAVQKFVTAPVHRRPPSSNTLDDIA